VPSIFHIARQGDWAAAEAQGTYRMSTLGLTLDDVGFIHCSYAHQVDGVARALYRDVRDLVLLTIDTDAVEPDIRVERGGGSERFPHIYGTLAVDAVVAVEPFPSPS
jgi:glutathione S-transferase